MSDYQKTETPAAFKMLASAAFVAGLAFVASFSVNFFRGSNWGMLRPANPQEFWAIVNATADGVAALSALALVAVGFRGLRSLRLTRIEMENRFQREATLSAIQRLEELATVVIPQNTPILAAMGQLKVEPYVKRSEDVRFDPDPKDLKPVQEWLAKLPVNLQGDITSFLNRLEAWSVYFTTGVADETVAFGPAAPLLRTWVGQYYPILLIERSRSRSGTYPNLIRLFKAWSDKMDEQQLATMHQDLVTQLERKRSGMSKAQLPLPLGSKIDD